MRVIGGALGGRRFRGPPGDRTRPTSERVREAVASALAARGAFGGETVLDLFAGTGALAFEALSRGADRAVLVEQDRAVARAIDESARSLGLERRARVVTLDLAANAETVARKLDRDGPFGLIFADPPYAIAGLVPGLLHALVQRGAIAPGALAVVEYASRTPPEGLETLGSVDFYRYGDTTVAILVLPPTPEPIP
ncbi:MAG: 16S rRNA (guanine(966)-N(2))-methyltransferase RsmD [Polyangiales bacterium]